MCGARAVLAHLNTLLAVVGGAALVACGVLSRGYVPEHAKSVPGATALLLVPYVCGPLLLILSHLAVVALLHAAPSTARVLLVVYSVCCTLAALAAGGVAGWAGYAVAEWLRDDEDALALVRADPQLRAWLRPLMPLVAEDVESTLPEEEIRAEVVVVLAVCLLAVLLLLVNAALALAARPRRLRDDEQALRRCSSVYYEPSAPAYKTPLDDPSKWQ